MIRLRPCPALLALSLLLAPGVDAAKERPLVVPAGVRLQVKLDHALDSRDLRAGDRFEATLALELRVDGRTVARKGSRVSGRVVDLVKAGRVKGRERLTLGLVSVRAGGRDVAIETAPITWEAESSTGRDGKVIGGTAGAGALIGAIAGGGSGLVKGAAIGAAAGTGGVLATRGKSVKLAAGSRIDFALAQPLRIQPGGTSTPSAPKKHHDGGEVSRL